MSIRIIKGPVTGLSFAAPLATLFVSSLLSNRPLLSVGIALACFGATRLVQSGFEIDQARRLQRTCIIVLGHSLGRWKSLVSIVGITLKHFTSAQHNNTPSSSSWGIWNDAYRVKQEVVVMLSIAHSNTGIIVKTLPLGELQATQTFAAGLAEQLGIPLNVYLPTSLTTKDR
ncbi:hypothetical protein [Hymenobacter oligotrophus]|uniref:hypothetical protein n=1 Tax=Hymenobacter oligotrophus TaxID=2319843 RepID=UPI0013C34905|nr:hypothetical protein [Hymenobacter oligotrophus]